MPNEESRGGGSLAAGDGPERRAGRRATLVGALGLLVDPGNEAAAAVPGPLSGAGRGSGLRAIPSRAPVWRPPRFDGALATAIRGVTPPAGTVGVAVHHLVTGAGAGMNVDAVVPPASLFKLGIMVAVMRDIETGRLSPLQELDILDADWAPGAGILQERVGEAVSVGEALRLMIGISDNVAAFVLLRAIGSARLNATTASLGMARTHFYVDERSDETCAGDAATALVQIATGQAGGSDTTGQMLALLAQRQAAAWIRTALPPGVRVAHKSGQLPGVRNDAAIVETPGGPYVLAVLTSDLADDADGERYIGEVARVADAHLAGSR